MSEEQKSPRKTLEVVVGEAYEGDIDPNELRPSFTQTEDGADVEGRAGWTWVWSPWGNLFRVYLVPGRNVVLDYFVGRYFYVYG